MKYILPVLGDKRLASPPARGAWIEIDLDKRMTEIYDVAPRTGGVD